MKADINLLSVLQSMPSAVLVIDRKLCIAFANHAAETLLGTSSSAMEGKELRSLLYHDSPLPALLERAFHEENLIREHNVIIAGPKFRTATTAMQISPLLMPESRQPAAHLVMVIEPQSLASKLSGKLNQRDSSKSTSMMAAILAHEIKNPLSGIRGAAQLLEVQALEDGQKLTRLICKEVDRIKTLIDELGLFAEHPEKKKEAVNVHEVVHHVIALLKSGTDLPVKIEEYYDPSLPPVSGYRDAMIQLFLNLLGNAIDALKEVRKPRIQIKTSYQGGVRIKLPGQDKRVSLPICITISDNGPGIPAELKPNIFEPFVTNKPRGKGLGLAIVAKIVADHGGLIDLEDDGPEAGARFTLMLPAFK